MAQQFTAWCKRPDWTPIITVFASDEAEAKQDITCQLGTHASGPHRQQYFREWRAAGSVTLPKGTRPDGWNIVLPINQSNQSNFLNAA